MYTCKLRRPIIQSGWIPLIMNITIISLVLLWYMYVHQKLMILCLEVLCSLYNMVPSEELYTQEQVSFPACLLSEVLYTVLII